MKQVVENAKTFSQRLSSLGLSVLGKKVQFTETHQVIVQSDEMSSYRLENCNVMVSSIFLPGDKYESPTGIRFGLTEVTRLGMKKHEVLEIAKLVVDALSGTRDPEFIKNEVIGLKNDFTKCTYCF
jgi:glycine hydroxymethyltransferase